MSPDRLADRQRAFREVLGRADTAGKPPETVARDAAEQFVAMTFVQPMLKGLRDSGGAAAPFAPTQAEKQFRGLLDADLARRIVGASNWPLVDRLARDLLQDQAPTAPAAGEDA
ncbi:MAG: hypothetical protein HRU70_15365 [Phycisphaeraceae bacterium]|nr:MAG: hypothetical protein HRU70_15365 [Phycisphaeraceae bacterium]